MNTADKDGGPAFPRADCYSDTHYTAPAQDGMTMRDYFAGQALANIVQRCGTQTSLQQHSVCQSLATSCYMLADAMLAARKAGTK